MNGNVVSSTGIRNLIQAGHIEYANRMLGRAYSITGKIVHGEQRGRKLGFPTANIELLHGEMAVPAPGVYAVTASIEGSIYEGMGNIGNNPTLTMLNMQGWKLIYLTAAEIYTEKQCRCSFINISVPKRSSAEWKNFAGRLKKTKKAIKTYFLNKKQLPDT